MFKLILTFLLDILIALILWEISDSIYHLSKLEKYQSIYNPLSQENFIYKIIFRLPILIAERFNDFRGDEFQEHGLYLFCGEQGSGKTYSMTYNINKLILQYPGVFILSNYGLLCQDKKLENANDLLKYKRGKSGIIFAVDEIQATWHSRTWSHMDPEIMAMLCQNRKSHRVIYGTCQSVSQVDKAIRLQTRRYIQCYCLLGILNVCLWYKPQFNFEGNLEISKLRKIQIFLQDPSIRYQYDTYYLINSLNKEVNNEK